MEAKLKIRGREITESDIKMIREIIVKYYAKGRKHISREICHQWKWYQANGATKDMACRYIMLFLERKGIIKLPPGIHNGNNEKKKMEKIKLKEEPLGGSVKDYKNIRLKLLTRGEEYKYWNRVIHSYHYQGYQVIVGKFLKYTAYIDDKPAALLGWGSAAWSMSSRDKWIGWSKEVKDKNLCGVVNNIRFLILPWVRIKYLASYLLGRSVKRVSDDWENKYGHPIYLLETFVERERFEGTCYKAANWKYLGETKGSAKKGSSHLFHGNIKKIFVYPLCRDFRGKLSGK